jgi:tail tube protein
MQATKATIGYLATFQTGDTSSPVNYTQMAELKNIKPNLVTVPVINATHLQSPNATEEKLPGLILPGTIDISGNHIGDTSQLSILALSQTRTVFPFKITAPINKGTQVYTIAGNGFFSKYDVGQLEPNVLAEFSATIEITGTLTETVV